MCELTPVPFTHSLVLPQAIKLDVPFSVPPPPYPLHALEPHMSQSTLEFHWGKHHRWGKGSGAGQGQEGGHMDTGRGSHALCHACVV